MTETISTCQHMRSHSLIRLSQPGGSTHRSHSPAAAVLLNTITSKRGDNPVGMYNLYQPDRRSHRYYNFYSKFKFKHFGSSHSLITARQVNTCVLIRQSQLSCGMQSSLLIRQSQLSCGMQSSLFRELTNRYVHTVCTICTSPIDPTGTYNTFKFKRFGSFWWRLGHYLYWHAVSDCSPPFLGFLFLLYPFLFCCL
jgi:hypothetical protein